MIVKYKANELWIIVTKALVIIQVSCLFNLVIFLRIFNLNMLDAKRHMGLVSLKVLQKVE
jgi:hypothetical protein